MQRQKNILSEIIEQIESKETVANKERLVQFEWASKKISLCSEDFSGVSITKNIDGDIVGDGVIRIEGKRVSIDDPVLFAAILRLADTIGIDPLTNKKISIEIDYKGVSIPIDRVVKR